MSPYGLHASNDELPDSHLNQLHWLDRWMLYIICVPRTPDGKNKSKCFKWSIVIPEISYLLFIIGVSVYWSIHYAKHKKMAVCMHLSLRFSL